jgi:hypothetical protein
MSHFVQCMANHGEEQPREKRERQSQEGNRKLAQVAEAIVLADQML